MPHKAPQFPFVARNYDVEAHYERGFSIAQLMPLNSVGIVTARDALTIDMERNALWYRVVDMKMSQPEDLRTRHNLGTDVRDWRVEWARADVTKHFSQSYLKAISYRPFDTRWSYYTGNSRGFMCYPRSEVMQHMLQANIGLASARSNKGLYPDHFFVSDTISEAKFAESSTQSALFPLYQYPSSNDQQNDVFAIKQRTLNLDRKIYAAICAAAGIDPADQAGPSDDFRVPTGEARPSEVKVFDYLYGTLHAPNYRETFAEFLKIDFPRAPYPPSPEIFRHVSEKGEQLRRLHLMESAAIGETPYPYLGEGDDVVASGYPKYEDGKVQISQNQYFGMVPSVAWTFSIGGYQPAQKWLKDRRGRTLSWNDIGHYQRIVKILAETDRIMREIDLPMS